MKAPGKYFSALLVLLLLVLGFIIYKDFLVFHYLFVYTDMKDMMLNVWPKYVHLSEYLRTSGFPSWSFNSGVGFNFFAGNLARVSIVDPTVLLLMLPDPHKLVYYLPYMLLFKIGLGSVLFYTFLLKVKITHFPAVIGALLYAFSGYSIIYGGWFDFTTEAIFLPVLLLAVESYIASEKKWYLVVLCYFWLALYNPVVVYFFAIFPMLYYVARKVSIRQSKTALRLALIYMKWVLLGVAMGFVLFWPVLSTLLSSPRVLSEGAGLFQLNSRLEYITIFGRLLSNDFFGSGSAFQGWGNYMEAPMYYCGLLALLLSTQPWGVKDRRKRIFPTVLVVFLVLFLLSPFFRGALNGFSGNYYRLTGYAIPFIIIFFGVSSLMRILKQKRVDKKVLSLTYVAILVVIGGLYLSAKNIVDTHVIASVFEFLTIYYLLFIFYQPRLNQRLFAAVLLVFVSVELVVFSLPAVSRPAIRPAILSDSAGYYDSSSRLISEITAKDTGFYRIDKDYYSVFCCNDAFMQNYKGTGYYESFAEKGYIDFLEGMGLTDSSFQYRSFGVFDNHEYIKELFGIKYGIYKKKSNAFEGYVPIKQEGDVTLYENTYFSSVGFVYDRYASADEFNRMDNEATNNSYNAAYQGKEKIMLSAVVMDDNVAQRDGLTKVDPNAVLSSFLYRDVALRNQLNAIVVTESGQKKITGTVNAMSGGLLYLAIPYNKGWQVLIDGQKIPIQKVNLGFIGVPISKGAHSVMVRYQEPYIYPSLVVSIIGIGVFLVTIRRDRRRR